MNLSVCILVNTWHDKLPKVIAAVENCCSEILLGINGDFNPEMYSEQLQFKNLRFVFLQWNGYGTTKNDLAQKAKNDWILSLDSDEIIDTALQQSISELNLTDDRQIFGFKMTHFLGDKPLQYGAWGKGKKYFYRLYNKHFTSWDVVDVHETLQKPAHAILVTLKGEVQHYTSNTFKQLLVKNRRYGQLSANKYRRQNKYIFPGRAYLSSVFNFLKEYVFQLGFLDGKVGWQVARANFYYTFWKYKL